MRHFVAWGGTYGHDSLRWIMAAYAQTARKLGWRVDWVPDEAFSRRVITAESTVLTADRWSEHVGEAVEGARYVVHNYDGSHELCQSAAPENLLRLQVWTNDASGEDWGPYRRFDKAGSILFQPWGADLLAEEFMEPTLDPTSRVVPFVGAVWSDVHDGVEMGNEAVITEVREACAELKLEFRHLTQIPTEAMVRQIRAARLVPAFAGAWQVERNYIPCRVLKAAACGTLPLTNVPGCLDILGGAALHGSVGEVMQEALAMGQARYLSLVREAQRNVSKFTYRESLTAIERAFEELAA